MNNDLKVLLAVDKQGQVRQLRLQKETRGSTTACCSLFNRSHDVCSICQESSIARS